MVIRCEKCYSFYNDENQWTICPHGPLWAPLNAYCKKHDLVDCVICKENPDERGSDETTQETGTGQQDRSRSAFPIEETKRPSNQEEAGEAAN